MTFHPFAILGIWYEQTCQTPVSVGRSIHTFVVFNRQSRHRARVLQRGLQHLR
jgi:hypothetical protein